MKRLLTSVLLAGAAFTASSANAAITFYFDDPGAIQPAEVVQVLNDQTALTVVGYTNQTNREVAVHSTDGGNLETSSAGQAAFHAVDNSLDSGEIYLTNLADNDFREIEFLFEGGAPKKVTLTFFSEGGAYQESIFLPKKAEGNYWFSALATGPDYFTKIKYEVTGADFNTLKQLRIGGFGDVPAVPEPSTWAMMLIGFGTVGFAMRRRSDVKVSFA